MIETSINQLTAAVVRLCDLIENKQLMLPLFSEQKVASNTTIPQEYEKKSTRGKKAAPSVAEAAAPPPEPEAPEQAPTSAPEPEVAKEPPAEEPCVCDEVVVTPTQEPEQPAAPTITHEMCTEMVREYRRHNAHLLAAKKINHGALLVAINEQFGIAGVSKCPDDKLPALYEAIVAICQPIEV